MDSNAYMNRDGDQLKVVVKEDQITVAPSERATLQVAIINGGANEESVAIRVKGLPQEWLTLQTPVVQMAPGETKLITLTLHPAAAADNRAVQYPLDIHVSSQTNLNRSAQVRILLTVAAYQSKGRIGLLLGSVHFSAVPGTRTSIPVVLQNHADEEDSFRLVVTGLPTNWIILTSSLTRLKPDTSTEIELLLQVPRSPRATAGRTRFTIQLISQLFPSQRAEVECILTIASFSQFSGSLDPSTLQPDQFGQVVVSNEGNTIDTYSLNFQGRGSDLIFTKAVQVVRPDTQQVGIGLVEIAPGERISVQAGEPGNYSFRARLRSRPIIGSEQTYPFKVEIRSTTNETLEISGQLNEAAWLPSWLVIGLISIGVIGFLILCILLIAPPRNLPTAARAIRMSLFGTWHRRILGVISWPGTLMGCERLGCPPAGMGTNSSQVRSKPAALYGHLAETNLGPAM